MTKNNKNNQQNTTLICSTCCRLIRVSPTWKNGDYDPEKDDEGKLSHTICPDCLRKGKTEDDAKTMSKTINEGSEKLMFSHFPKGQVDSSNQEQFQK